MDDAASTYRPGVCNIGPDEIERRRRSAVALFAAAGFVAVALLAFHVPAPVRLLLFLPLAAASVTWLQVRRRFCVGFGLLGLLNFGRLGAEERVADATARAADRRTALRMVLEGSLAAAVVTAGFLVLPF